MKIKKMLPVSQIRATISDDAVNEENRTVELVWTTGHKGLRSNWGERYYEELSLEKDHVDMTRLEANAPLLASHDSYSLDSVIGVVERAEIKGGKGTATVRFAKDEASDAIFQKVKDKILRNVSVGYSVQRYEKVSDGEEEIPTFRATRWTPMEISIVPIGFDPGAQTRNQPINENEVEIITRSEDTQENTDMKLRFNAQLLDKAGEADGGGSTSQKVDAEALKREAVENFKKTATEIRAYVQSLELDSSVAEEMIERGLAFNEAKANADTIKRALEASKKLQVESTTRVEIGKTGEEKKRDAIESALIHRVDKKGFDATIHSSDFVGMSVVRMCEELLGGRKGLSDVEIVKRAMSTSDLPKILANVAEKSAARQYKTAKSTFEPWTNKGDLRNYKPAKQVKLGDFSDLQPRKENGEFKYGSMGEEQEVAQLEDYGRILKLTKQMLIDDDLGVLTQIISRGGLAGKRLESKKVYEALTSNPTMDDGVALFHANHGNLGSAAAINDTSMKAAVAAMRKQMTIDDADYLELAPKFLIVGPDKENEARKFLASILAAQTSNVNIYANTMDLIVENRISGNAWFLAADPSEVDTVTLFKLSGQDSPVISTRENWSDSSVEFKVEHTIDAAPMDYRGLYYNPGA